MAVFSDPLSKPYARLTGVFYLAIAVFGGFAILWVPSQLQVPGDASATMANLIGRRGLFLAGMGGEVAILVAEVMCTAMLYFMFKPVNATLSFAAALARLSMVGVMAGMLFFSAAAMGVAEGSLVPSLADEVRAEVVAALLYVHDAGVWVWQVFFTLHLMVLGWLVAGSQRFPRVLGYLMMAGSAGYLCDSLSAFVWPDASGLAVVTGVLLAVVSLAEVGFALWLVIRGQRTV